MLRIISLINAEGKKRSAYYPCIEKMKVQVLALRLKRIKKIVHKDILIICADGLHRYQRSDCGSISKTEYQRCIVHQMRKYSRNMFQIKTEKHLPQI